MKAYMLLLVVLVVSLSSVNAADVREYESLAAAITAIGTAETDLTLSGPQSVSTALTVPPTSRLRSFSSGSVQPSTYTPPHPMA